jgi:hypothetical protein
MQLQVELHSVATLAHVLGVSRLATPGFTARHRPKQLPTKAAEAGAHSVRQSKQSAGSLVGPEA